MWPEAAAARRPTCSISGAATPMSGRMRRLNDNVLSAALCYYALKADDREGLLERLDEDLAVRRPRPPDRRPHRLARPARFRARDPVPDPPCRPRRRAAHYARHRRRLWPPRLAARTGDGREGQHLRRRRLSGLDLRLRLLSSLSRRPARPSGPARRDRGAARQRRRSTSPPTSTASPNARSRRSPGGPPSWPATACRC